LFWGVQEDNAAYIHSFTISRALAGQGIGECVLGLIESHCRQNKKELLRLDCGVNIKGLRKYYEQYGFKPVGEVTVLGERLTLYEKQIT
jgi:ribosomal protein S18 acetylase RimI-like enzyme